MAAPSCDRNSISRDGDDAVIDSLQLAPANSLRENFMLKKHSSELVSRTTRLYDISGNGEAHLVFLENDNKGIAHENQAWAARPDLGRFEFASGHAEGDENGLTEHNTWSAKFTFLVEGFALCGASLYSTAAFPVVSFLTQEKTQQQTRFSSAERRGSMSPVSPSAIPGLRAAEQQRDAELQPEDDGPVELDRVPALDTGRSGRWNWLRSCWETAVTLKTRWRREREIKGAVATLVELDDRTLRDMGIPDRSQIEQVVRYGRDRESLP